MSLEMQSIIAYVILSFRVSCTMDIDKEFINKNERERKLVLVGRNMNIAFAVSLVWCVRCDGSFCTGCTVLILVSRR